MENLLINFMLFIEVIIVFITIFAMIKRKKVLSVKNTYLYPFIILIGIILYSIGLNHCNDLTKLQNFFSSINFTLRAITLDFRFGEVLSYVNQNFVFKVALLTLYGLSIFSFLSVLLSVFIQSFLNKITRKIIKLKDYDIIIGNSELADQFIKSAKKRSIICLSEGDGNQLKAIFNSKHAYHIGKIDLKKLISYKKNINVISFFKKDNEVLELISQAIDLIKSNEMKKEIRFYFLVDSQQKDIMKRVEEEGKGYITTFDKYELIALKFLNDYYFAQYFNDSIANYHLATLKEGYEITINFIGFGKVNQKLLPYILADNQFVTIQNQKLVPVKIHVNIFDLKNQLCDLNLNHTLLKYQKSSFENNHFFDPADNLAKINFYHNSDIGERGFYQKIDEHIHSKSLNFFIVSFQEDLENYECAVKIYEHLQESRVSEFHQFFVRTNYAKQHLSSLKINETYPIHFFGSMQEVISYEDILGDKLMKDAIKRNYAYNHSISQLQKESFMAMKEEWSKLSRLKQLSNQFSVLHLNNMLAMMNKKVGDDISEIYLINNKKIEDIDYWNIWKEKDFSLRKNLAMMEHLRWTSFMIMMGYIPLEKEEIYIDENKNICNSSKSLRKHACITSFDGLMAYEDFLANLYAKQFSFSYEKARNITDTLKYDYQIMDNYLKSYKQEKTKN